MSAQIQLHLLGQFQLTVDGEPVAGLTSEKIQALVAYLAVEQARSHSREFLAELLWPDRPAGVARQNLRQALSRLQRALPIAAEPLLQISRQAIRFPAMRNVQVDFVAFVAVLAQVQQHPHDRVITCPPCCQLLTTAVTHYQGDFLAGLLCDSPIFDEWVLLQREWARREVLRVLDLLVQHHEAAQRWHEAYKVAWRRVEIDPLLEEAHQQVMRALAYSGRRTEALAQYDTLTRLLQEELGVAPATISTALYEAIRTNRLGVIAPSPPNRSEAVTDEAIPHNLPTLHTPFVGRQQELRRIEERLAQPECHLLTLVGPGGAGKTRLALEVAARQQQQTTKSRYPDGIYFVELATIEDLEQMLRAVAGALHYQFPEEAQGAVGRQAALLDYLHAKQLLLLLDNYEQLADLTTLPLALLAEASQVQLLVTSRVPLHLRAEWLLDIAGLAYPAVVDLQAAADGRSVATFEAVQFFAGAAQRVLADFTLSDQTLPAVGHLCALTQGMPLALELAAAQIRAVPLPVLVNAVQQNLDTLVTTMRDVPARHRSLRAVFEHSWALLTPALQELFSRLAVFRGTFSAAAAVAVTGCSPAALAQLCAYSLIQTLEANPGATVEPSGQIAKISTPRYAMHEVLHQYAVERLQLASATEKHTRAAHSRYYLTLVADKEASLNGSSVAQSVALLHTEFDNIRSGWQWACATHDLATLQQATHGLLRHFVLTSQAEEGGNLFEEALHHVAEWLTNQSGAADTTRRAAQQLLAELHALRARLYFKQARYAEGIDHAERALLIAEAYNAVKPAALANLYWGICLMNQGAYGDAEGKLTAALEWSRSIGWHKVEGDALRGLGILADMQDDLSKARHFYAASLALSEGLDDPRGTSASLGNLGTICRRQGDFATARRFLEESLTIHRMIGDRSSEGRTLTHLGELSVDLEEYREAERYFGEAIHLLQKLGEEHHAADALVALGKLYYEQGRIELALACWVEAEPIYKAANELPQLTEVHEYLRLAKGKTRAY